MAKKLNDIAQILGVSVVTVSNALNDKDGISEEMRAKIKKLALEMGYTKYVTAELAKGKTKNIAILISERNFAKQNMTSSFYLGFFESFSRKFLSQKYCPVLFTVKASEELEGELPPMVDAATVEGIVVIGGLKKPLLDAIKRSVLPYIFVDFYDRSHDRLCVLTDNITGSYHLTKLLIENGHSKIAFVGRVDATSSINDRYIGYYKAMFEQKLSIPPDYVICDRDDNDIYIPLRLPEDMPTAFVCNSDRAAFTLYRQLAAKNFKVGEDVSVVGFDDDIFSTICEPPLTTIAVDVEQMTLRASEILIKSIENKHQTTGDISVPGKIIIRNSVKNIAGV